MPVLRAERWVATANAVDAGGSAGDSARGCELPAPPSMPAATCAGTSTDDAEDAALLSCFKRR